MKKATGFIMALLLTGTSVMTPVLAATDGQEKVVLEEENIIEEDEQTAEIAEEMTEDRDAAGEGDDITGFTSDGDFTLGDIGAGKPEDGAYVEGEALVVWKNGSVTVERDGSMNMDSALSEDFYLETLMDAEREVTGEFEGRDGSAAENTVISLVSSDSHSTEEIIDIMEKRADVEIAEPNYICSEKSLDLNDTYEEYLWQLENNGNGQSRNTASMNVPNGWAQDKSSEPVVVAVLDSGVDYNHPDLVNRMWINDVPGLVGVYGYDFCNNDSDPMDDFGHGSHCAGIIAAEADNAAGVTGVAGSANVQIMALKHANADGMSSYSNSIAAYDYMAKAIDRGVNLVAVNNSWGSPTASLAFDKAMTVLGEKGVLSLNASGNDSENKDEIPDMPGNSRSPYAISVAASNESGSLAAYSNYGKKEVDIIAPGTNILSTVSYPNFLPVIYGNERERLVDQYREFSTDTVLSEVSNNNGLRKYRIDGGTSDAVSGAGGMDQVYADGGKLSVADKGYLGDRTNETGGDRASLSWELDIKEGENYYLALPVTGAVNPESQYSVMVNVDLESRETEAMTAGVFMIQMQEDQGCLSVVKDSEYGGLFDEAYNDHILNYTAPIINSGISALGVAVVGTENGKVTVNISAAGISDPHINTEEFGYYDVYSGTSMAAPAAAGAVALLSAVYPDMDTLTLRNKLLSMTNQNNGTGRVVGAGAVDFAMITEENPVVTDVSAEGDSVVIKGNNLGADIGMVSAALDGQQFQEAEIKSWSTTEVTIAYEEQWNCRDLNLLLNTFDGRQITHRTYLISGRKSFEKVLSHSIDSIGYPTSDGKNVYYIISDSAGMFLAEFDGRQEEYMEIPFEEILMEAGFDEYNQDKINEIIFQDNICHTDGSIYFTVNIVSGYEEKTLMISYDIKKKMWNVDAGYASHFSKVNNLRAVAYNSDLYYPGGIREDGSYSRDLIIYHTDKKKWEVIEDGLPGEKPLLFGVMGQFKDHLYLMMGADEDGNLDRNVYAYDGSKWAVTGQLPQPIHSLTSFQGRQNYMAAGGACRVGFAISGVTFPGYGDTVIYDVEKDKLQKTEYNLCSRVNDNETRGVVCGNYFYVWSLQGDNDNLDMARMPVDNIRYVSSLKLNKTSVSLKPGKTVQLKATVNTNADNKKITWKSSNSKYASVSSGGKVTARKAGNGKTVTITAVAADRGTVKAACRIKIEYPVTKIQIKKSSRYIKAGSKMTLKAVLTPSNAANKKITWKSSNVKYASVNSKGVVTAKKAGIGKSVKIYATSANGRRTYRLLKITK